MTTAPSGFTTRQRPCRKRLIERPPFRPRHGVGRRRCSRVIDPLASSSQTTKATAGAQRPRAPVAALSTFASKKGVMKPQTQSSPAMKARIPSQRPRAPVCRITFDAPKKKIENTPPPRAIMSEAEV